MRLKFDSARAFVLLVNLVLAGLLAWLFGGEGPLLPFAALLLVGATLWHEPLLRHVRHWLGFTAGDEYSYLRAFLDLNRKIHTFQKVDDVLLLVDDALRDKIRARRTVFLLNTLFTLPPGDARRQALAGNGALQCWPDASMQLDDVGCELIHAVMRRGEVFSVHEAAAPLQRLFEDSGTSLALPVIQQGRLLCLILIGRLDDSRPYSEFEYQTFNYLANQLGIILDRIRVYDEMLHQTAMDHAERMRVMQSLSANIAHEMRTPLSGIRASIGGIADYLPELLGAYDYARLHAPERFPAIRENHLATLKGTPDRVTLMIDQANTVIDMLLMNLREASFDRQQLQTCSAAHCVEQAVDRYPFRSGEREKVRLDLAQDFRFQGVEVLFVFILFNLLKNALYAIRSAQKGDILIRLEHGAGGNRLVFRDTGIGMEPAVRARIFEGFFTTKAEGTGAGLAFCKRTVESFGGRIDCVSEPGRFTEFHIDLPAPTEPEAV